MNKRKERLEQLIAEEEHRRSDLENEEAYVKLRKSIGYVYPDEILFRKDDN